MNPIVQTIHKKGFMKKQTLLLLLLIAFYNALGQQSPPTIIDINFSVNKPRELEIQLNSLPIFKRSFSGLCIYDVERKKYIIEQNASRYFTPASNVKLFAFYAGLEYLGEKIPALKYIVHGDSLIFWGTGNPMFLHPDETDTIAYHFLKNAKQKLYFAHDNFQDNHLGYSWAWDDYDAYYSPEKNSFPIYGNILRINAETNGSMKIQPQYFVDSLTKLSNTKNISYFWATRDLHSNKFTYIFPKKIKRKRERDIPLVTSPECTARLLSNALKRRVTLIDKHKFKLRKAKTLYTVPVDSLYKPMLRRSDNFYAEMILYMCADSLKNGLNTLQVIKKIQEEKLADLSHPPNWVDGSGLSRQNLFTPKSMVEILLKILDKRGTSEAERTRLFHLLPTGGKSGTLKRRFKKHPGFVHAKTGTLSNNHNLSGYLRTKSGKLLVFSYMNNHYLHDTKHIKAQTDIILTDFYLHYK